MARGKGLDLTLFFQEQGIDVFSEVALDNLSAEDRSSVLQFFPAAQSVIVFGKEVPVPVYRMPPKEKTAGMLRVAESVDRTAVRLAGCLEAEQVPAKPVPLYLPVRVEEGRVRGVVRLKQVAAAGGLGSPGKNTVLINPRFGPRLLLSGVVVSRFVPYSNENDNGARREENPCTGCGRCIKVCPERALGPEGVDTFRCRTVSAWVPPFLVPFAKWMLGRTLVLKCLAPCAPWIARTATIRCSLCVTECPIYSKGGE
jgi:epoxyqueuosine reductase QueG